MVVGDVGSFDASSEAAYFAPDLVFRKAKPLLPTLNNFTSNLGDIVGALSKCARDAISILSCNVMPTLDHAAKHVPPEVYR